MFGPVNPDALKFLSGCASEVLQKRHVQAAPRHRGDANEVENSREQVYALFPILKQRHRQLAGTMSGGEQQMLAIARALMALPRILLVDEPSVGLAPILVAKTIETIATLQKQLGLTVLMAEQNFRQAIRIADRGYVLVHGQIALTADDANTLRHSELVRRFYLGAG